MSYKPDDAHRLEDTAQISKCWFQILAIFSVSIVAFNAASLFYWTSPSIPVILESEVYNTTLDEASYLTVIPSIGMVVGSPIYCGLMDIVGRKNMILTTGVLHLTAWLLVVFGQSMRVLFISRFVFGLGDACLFSVVPIYISEVATPTVRSSWGNMMMILVYVAQFLINAVGYFLDLRRTAFVFMGFPVLFLIMFAFMPETPYYHLMKKRDYHAANSLKKLRQTNNVNDEFAQLKSDVNRQLSETGTIKDLFTNSTNTRAMLVCSVVRLIQQFSGVSAFALYTQYIFGQAIGSLDKGQSAMIYSGMLAFASMIGAVVLDKLGRRNAMVVSCAGCAAALFGEAAYFYVQQNTAIDVTSVTWFPMVGMCVYVLFLSVALSIIPTIIVGELFSASIKSKATCVMNVAFAAFIGISTKVFQLLTTNFGLYVPFAVFGLCAFLGMFTCWYIVPETKGKTLEEIQQAIRKGNKH